MNTPFHLDQKTVLVTGASSGIGRQTAISISRMGGTLVLSGRNEERLKETLLVLEGGHHRIITADLNVEADRERLATETPGLDGLVHCAGVVASTPIRFYDQRKIDEMMHANFESPVLLMSALLRLKKINRNASLVFLSSIAAQHPHRGGALYGSSKAAMETFTKVLALELYTQGIRANCLSPAVVRTPMFDHAETQMSKEEMDKHVARYPLGAGLPEDVANAAIFLLSPASRWITGISLLLDGGLLLGI